MIRRVLQSIRRREEPDASAGRLIVGLGNIGSKYAGTRHNLGFEVVDELAKKFHADSPRHRFDARIHEVTISGTRVVLAAPTTMMNNSGFAVSQLVRWYKLPPEEVLVIYDELDIPFGKMRLRPSGGDGGHNGIKSIIEQMGTSDFPRVRVGVGRPTSGSTIGFLLSRFSAVERKYVPEVVSLAADAAACWAESGINEAMNQFNTQSIAVEVNRTST